jgi:hypothetical protein
MNLSLDDFSDAYIERMSSTNCPNCGLSTELATLLSRFENDHLRLDFKVVPKPLPVILYLSRPARDQAAAFTSIREWVIQAGQAAATQLQEILDQRRAEERETYGEERDSYGVLEELSEILFEWKFIDDPACPLNALRLELRQRARKGRRTPAPKHRRRKP